MKFQGPPVRWMKLSLLNFVVAVLAGVFTRYKVSYSLAQIDFKNLLHAHSHFAFSAWASSALFAMLIAFFLNEVAQRSKLLSRLFVVNQIASYGMLFSFLIQEYGPISIAFSTLSILVSYAYAWVIWYETRNEKNAVSISALRFSLICLVISSIGPFSLAYMEAAHVMNLIYFSSAVYWYLHFQYNGWFSFAVFAIVLRLIESRANGIVGPNLKTFYKLMVISCIPVFLVSVLWIAPAKWIYLVAGTAGFIQLVSVYFLLKEFFERRSHHEFQHYFPGRRLLAISFLSLVLKLVLQFFCVFPVLNQFVFGHRPVIIGYLHLVLVGFLSFFLIGISLKMGVLNFANKLSKIGLLLFVAGFLLQEFALLVHGIDNVMMVSMPMIPSILFAAALMMLAGIVIFVLEQKTKEIL